MAGASEPDPVSTKQQRIAELAKQSPQMGFTSLTHHIDLRWLHEAYLRTRQDGAPGVDGQTAADYAANLRGQPAVAAGPGQVRHVPGTAGAAGAHPERDGRRDPADRDPDVRGQGAPAGGRHGAGSRSTSRTFWTARTASGPDGRRTRRWTPCGSRRWRWVAAGSWRWTSGSSSTRWIMLICGSLLRQRVRDGVLLRLIGKWLNAGVLEDGELTLPEAGIAAGRGDLSAAGQRLPALCAGRVVRAGGASRGCKGVPS